VRSAVHACNSLIDIPERDCLVKRVEAGECSSLQATLDIVKITMYHHRGFATLLPHLLPLECQSYMHQEIVVRGEQMTRSLLSAPPTTISMFHSPLASVRRVAVNQQY
jgi:hypothetical protein